jgi:hypothetical protein
MRPAPARPLRAGRGQAVTNGYAASPTEQTSPDAALAITTSSLLAKAQVSEPIEYSSGTGADHAWPAGSAAVSPGRLNRRRSTRTGRRPRVRPEPVRGSCELAAGIPPRHRLAQHPASLRLSSDRPAISVTALWRAPAAQYKTALSWTCRRPAVDPALRRGLRRAVKYPCNQRIR